MTYFTPLHAFNMNKYQYLYWNQWSRSWITWYRIVTIILWYRPPLVSTYFSPYVCTAAQRTRGVTCSSVSVLPFQTSRAKLWCNHHQRHRVTWPPGSHGDRNSGQGSPSELSLLVWTAALWFSPSVSSCCRPVKSYFPTIMCSYWWLLMILGGYFWCIRQCRVSRWWCQEDLRYFYSSTSHRGTVFATFVSSGNVCPVHHNVCALLPSHWFPVETFLE